ncbi:MAG: hypothetical protein E7425_11965 [Ruminococcaceae bacterium]|nr:hypothetical protein [Oscillospiraceae bacterium]MBE7004967.1 hypothetical protein [Oscillospiraceae bacterium]
MTGIARNRRLRYVTVELLPLRSLLLALFFMLGVLCAYLAAGRCAAGMGDELRRYLDGYLGLAAEHAFDARTAAQTLICFLRAPAAAFLMGFASIGVVGLPLLFAAQGFLLGFSLFCFSLAVGRAGFVLLPVLFALRLLFVVPCTFVLGSAALEHSLALASLASGGGKRLHSAACSGEDWYRFAVCCVLLVLGAALELWLLPLLLASWF